MPARDPGHRSLANKKRALARWHPDADTSELDRDLKAARASEYVRRLVSEAPPLTELQRARLAALLLGARPDRAEAKVA